MDAEGDGYFTGVDDRIEADNNANGNPDILIGDRSRSLEIFAWPLVPLPPNSEITISARLLSPERDRYWRLDAENTIAAPPPPASTPISKPAAKEGSSKPVKER